MSEEKPEGTTEEEKQKALRRLDRTFDLIVRLIKQNAPALYILSEFRHLYEYRSAVGDQWDNLRRETVIGSEEFQKNMARWLKLSCLGSIPGRIETLTSTPQNEKDKFKTSYALRDLEFIESVMGDAAISEEELLKAAGISRESLDFIKNRAAPFRGYHENHKDPYDEWAAKLAQDIEGPVM